jgi:hypothetical protein
MPAAAVRVPEAAMLRSTHRSGSMLATSLQRDRPIIFPSSSYCSVVLPHDTLSLAATASRTGFRRRQSLYHTVAAQPTPVEDFDWSRLLGCAFADHIDPDRLPPRLSPAFADHIGPDRQIGRARCCRAALRSTVRRRAAEAAGDTWLWQLSVLSRPYLPAGPGARR